MSNPLRGTQHSGEMIEAGSQEWALAVQRLQLLTLAQLQEMASQLGINFHDERGITSEDYINIMDETSWGEFEAAYSAVTADNDSVA